MPRAATRAGYVRLPGPSRRYLNTATGETLSRRQYDNLSPARRQQTSYQALNQRAKAAGWDSYSQYRRKSSKNAPKWAKWKARLKDADPDLDLGAFSRLQRAAFEAEDNRRGVPRDALGNYVEPAANRDPDGPLAQLLIALGYRQPTDTWQIGDTPR